MLTVRLVWQFYLLWTNLMSIYFYSKLCNVCRNGPAAVCHFLKLSRSWLSHLYQMCTQEKKDVLPTLHYLFENENRWDQQYGITCNKGRFRYKIKQRLLKRGKSLCSCIHMHTNLPCKGRSSPAWILSWREPPAIALAFFLSVIIWTKRERRVRTTPSCTNSPDRREVFNIHCSDSGFLSHLTHCKHFPLVIFFCMKSFNILSSIKRNVLLPRLSVKYGAFRSRRTWRRTKTPFSFTCTR